MDFPDRLRADGLPFVSKTFRVDSRLVSQAALESLLFQTGGPAPLQPRFHRQLPTRRHSVALDVMNFPTDTLLICLLHKEIPVTMRVVC
jgi:hypothetical protein